jgi:hypothetical protein
MRKDIINLATDLARGKVQNFSIEQANDTLREAFAGLMEYSTESKDGKFEIDRKTFRKHKAEIFEILEEAINIQIQDGLANQFEEFAEYRNLAWGDTNLFELPARNIFRVSLVSDGNGNIRRQRLRDGSKFTVSLDTYAIKIGEDFHRFLAGRIQWADLMAVVSDSFVRDLRNRIYNSLFSSYGKYNAIYHFSGNVTEDDLVELSMHIEARTGESVAVYGTKLALRRLAPNANTITLAMNDARNKVGYYGEIAGITLNEIPQSHDFNNDNFVISNDMILVLPQSREKLIKVINEGDAIIQDQMGGMSSDMMQEYFIANRFGIAVITTKVFGFIKLPSQALPSASHVQ